VTGWARHACKIFRNSKYVLPPSPRARWGTQCTASSAQTSRTAGSLRKMTTTRTPQDARSPRNTTTARTPPDACPPSKTKAQYVHRCTLQNREKFSTKYHILVHTSTYQYIPMYDPEVCTGYILFTPSMYWKTYIITKYVQVYTKYILERKSTWAIKYILVPRLFKS
jgi:hypothetical protein